MVAERDRQRCLQSVPALRRVGFRKGIGNIVAKESDSDQSVFIRSKGSDQISVVVRKCKLRACEWSRSIPLCFLQDDTGSVVRHFLYPDIVLLSRLIIEHGVFKFRRLCLALLLAAYTELRSVRKRLDRERFGIGDIAFFVDRRSTSRY